MIYFEISFAWISGFVYHITLAFFTSTVKDGVCYGHTVWRSRAAEVAHGIWNYVSYFLIILLIFVVCYWRILATRQ